MFASHCKHYLLLPKRCSFIHATTLSPIIIPSRFAFSTSTCIPPSAPNVLLTFEKDSSVAILTLCNPKRRNALTVSMMEQLDAHVQTLVKWSGGGDVYERNGAVNANSNEDSAADADGVKHESNDNNARVLILTGANETFCSGLDLHDNEQTDNKDGKYEYDTTGDNSSVHPLKEGINMLHHMTRVTNQLHSLPVLSVSAIDGYAVGGGAELTTCTDLVVLSRSAQIRFVHAKRGASPGWGGGRRLVQKVGRGRALRMLLLGECVCGEEEAAQTKVGNGGIGGVYADAIAEEGESALEATMRMVVEPVLELPCARSVRAIKRVVSYADGDGEVMDLATDGRLKLDTNNMALKGEMESFQSVWGGESNQEQIRKAKDRLRDKKN